QDICAGQMGAEPEQRSNVSFQARQAWNPWETDPHSGGEQGAPRHLSPDEGPIAEIPPGKNNSQDSTKQTREEANRRRVTQFQWWRQHRLMLHHQSAENKIGRQYTGDDDEPR